MNFFFRRFSIHFHVFENAPKEKEEKKLKVRNLITGKTYRMHNFICIRSKQNRTQYGIGSSKQNHQLQQQQIKIIIKKTFTNQK